MGNVVVGKICCGKGFELDSFFFFGLSFVCVFLFWCCVFSLECICYGSSGYT